MDTFREQAKDILESYRGSIDMGQFNDALDALTALHQKEVERIIGEDDIPGDNWTLPKKGRNELRAEQRRRAGLEGDE